MKLLFWCLGLLFSTASFSLQVEISAEAAILINADTGVILYEKNAHVPRFPASTTKIATALYLLEQKKISFDQTVSVSAEAIRRKSAKSTAPYLLAGDATLLGVLKGEVLSLGSLMHGLLLISGNDAANVLAEAVSPSIPHFMTELNRYLESIGCAHTQFQNPHGYHDPQHITTACDLALMARRAFQLPVFREIVSKQSHTIPATNKRPETQLKQFNRQLVPGKHYYSKSIGGKTGFHSYAGWCLVSAAVHEGRTLIAVVLGCPQNENRFLDSRNLFEAAFKEGRLTRLLVPIDEVYHQVIPGAKSELKASLTRDLSLSFYPAEEQTLRAFIHWQLPTLPIAKGQKVGEIRVMDQRGSLVTTENLVAKEPVFPTFFFSLKKRWEHFWKSF